MNAKTIGGLIVLIILLAVGWYFFRMQQQIAKFKDAKEIVEESFEKNGAVANARYVGVVDGPIDRVQEAVWAVERSSEMIDNIKKSELIKSEGNTKTVILQLQALNLPLQQNTMQFTLDPVNHQVTFITIQAQAADLQGAYKLEASPDGARTRITWESTSTDKIAVPFPDAVIEGANRETFVNFMRGIAKALKTPAAG